MQHFGHQTFIKDTALQKSHSDVHTIKKHP
jgi:hypothetical protein